MFGLPCAGRVRISDIDQSIETARAFMLRYATRGLASPCRWVRIIVILKGSRHRAGGALMPAAADVPRCPRDASGAHAFAVRDRLIRSMCIRSRSANQRDVIDDRECVSSKSRLSGIHISVMRLARRMAPLSINKGQCAIPRIPRQSTSLLFRGLLQKTYRLSHPVDACSRRACERRTLNQSTSGHVSRPPRIS
jgi:hypothetical protein